MGFYSWCQAVAAQGLSYKARIIMTNTNKLNEYTYKNQWGLF